MGEIAIVTGYTGTAHVKSMHDRSRIAGVVGTGAYVLPTGNKLKAEMQNANTVRVLDGDLVLQGCHATIAAGTYQDLKIDNGTQGMKRHDLVVARYERRAQDPKTESVTLKIVKGTPSASPADPDVATGDVLAGNLVSEVALWRIPLDGLNVGDPIALFDVLMPMSELRDSVSRKLDAAKVSVKNVDNVTFGIGSNGNFEIWFNNGEQSVCLNFSDKHMGVYDAKTGGGGNVTF